MSIQCGWLRRSYWTAIVIHIIGSDEHIAMLSSTVIINISPLILIQHELICQLFHFLYRIML